MTSFLAASCRPSLGVILGYSRRALSSHLRPASLAPREQSRFLGTMATPEDLVKDDHAKSLINLLRGWPSTSLLPIELLKKAAKDVLSDTSISYPGLLYGPDAGHPRLREALSVWLTEFYGPPKPIKSERIAITGGASQNLGSLLQVFTDAIYTRHVWLVAPAYMLAFRIFEDAGFGGKMRAVPEDEDGIDIAFLRRALRKSEEKARLDGNDKPVRAIREHILAVWLWCDMVYLHTVLLVWQIARSVVILRLWHLRTPLHSSCVQALLASSSCSTQLSRG